MLPLLLYVTASNLMIIMLGCQRHVVVGCGLLLWVVVVVMIIVPINNLYQLQTVSNGTQATMYTKYLRKAV